MTNGGIKFDKTINLSTVVMVLGMLIASAMWVQQVNSKLDDVAQLIVSQGKMSSRLDEIEREILVNRQATLENRRVYQEGQK